jgi:DNA-binding NarL/FixJ family response regulator
LIKYVIADDHTIFRQGLQMALGDDKELECIGEVSDGNALLTLLETQSPDIILLDIKMPGMDGREATFKVRELYKNIKILVLTMHDDEQFVLHLMEKGANGYLIKNTDADEIKLAIHTCVENGYYFSDFVNKIMLKSLITNSQIPVQFRDHISLNERETKVLKLICEGLTATEIGKQIFLSPRTVEGIKSLLLDKIGVRNTAGLIIYAVKNSLTS